jgi:hypothetical protein
MNLVSIVAPVRLNHHVRLSNNRGCSFDVNAAKTRRIAASSPFRKVHGRAFFTDHFHFVLPALEITREFVGRPARDFVGVAVGLAVDIGGMADRSRRQVSRPGCRPSALLAWNSGIRHPQSGEGSWQGCEMPDFAAESS